ncbi:MAG TPA: hypothetical protein PLK91_02340, partial [Sphaerochaeta sp.]|nr:hypothetical protein [Sphaerochaeta sp.]HQB91057.1 hypothetical protein [Sphaerochaeta sp.]
MNWSFKKVALILLVLCMAFGLAADNSVFIGDGDVGSLKLYDRNGRPLDATMEDASEIGEGWILHNPGSDLLIVTPVGTANLYQDSLAITTELGARDIEITLVRGKGTFRATGLLGGSLTISTPASRYTLRDEGELFVVTSDTEESVTVFSGTVESYNLITRKSSTIDSFEKLYMQNMSRTSETIQRGYFLTYGTYPTAPATERVVTPTVPVTAKAEAPRVPATTVVEPPKPVQPVTTPIAEPATPPVAVPEAPVSTAPVAEPIVPAIEAAPVASTPAFIAAIVEEPLEVVVEEP